MTASRRSRTVFPFRPPRRGSPRNARRDAARHHHVRRHSRARAGPSSCRQKPRRWSQIARGRSAAAGALLRRPAGDNAHPRPGGQHATRFPRLASIVARDGYLRGSLPIRAIGSPSRTASSRSASSRAAADVFEGDTHALIPLYDRRVHLVHAVADGDGRPLGGCAMGWRASAFVSLGGHRRRPRHLTMTKAVEARGSSSC